MVEVEKVSGGRVNVRGMGHYEIGDRDDLSADDARYLVEERGDFEYVDGLPETEPDAEPEETGETDDDDGDEAELLDDSSASDESITAPEDIGTTSTTETSDASNSTLTADLEAGDGEEAESDASADSDDDPIDGSDGDDADSDDSSEPAEDGAEDDPGGIDVDLSSRDDLESLGHDELKALAEQLGIAEETDLRSSATIVDGILDHVTEG